MWNWNLQIDITNLWSYYLYLWWHCTNVFLDWQFGSTNRQQKRWWNDTCNSNLITVDLITAFQEKLVKAVKTVRKATNIPKSRRLSFINKILLTLDINFNTKNEPTRFGSLADISENVIKFSKHYLIWLLSRKQNAFD